MSILTAILAGAMMLSSPSVMAGEVRALVGGGQTTFSIDLDGDGDVDGAYFGLAIDLQEDAVTGHFVCAMWGNTEYLGLPLMAVEGPVLRATLHEQTGSVTFEGQGTVDLGSDEKFFTGVPFRAVVKVGGPGVGKLTLTIEGILDGVPGDQIIGNNSCDLPIETVASGRIALSLAAPTVTAVEMEATGRPTTFRLGQNAPNPFNPETTISFELPEMAEVRLSITNLAGQEVRTLVQGAYQPGWYSVVWDGRDAAEQEVASGVYLYRLEGGGRGIVETKRMVLVR
jgi:hypothetical protein